jgi:hypothetical protein
VSDEAALAAAAAAFRLRCRSQKMKTMQPQRRARQPNVPPIIAPVVLGGPLVVGLGSGFVFVFVSVSSEDEDEPGSGGVVLFGKAGSVVDFEGVSVSGGVVEEDDAFGWARVVGDGSALVVKALYSSVLGPRPHAM